MVQRLKTILSTVHVGLRPKIVASITVVVIVLIVLIGIVVLKITERNIIAFKIQEGDLAMRAIQAGVRVSCGEGRGDSTCLTEDGVRNLVKSLAERLDLEKFLLVDDQYKVIVAYDSALERHRIRDQEMQEAYQKGKLVKKPLPGRAGKAYEAFRFTGPLVIAGRVAGCVRFQLSLEDGYRMLALTRRLIVMYIVLDTVTIILFGSYLLSRQIVKPMQEIIQAAEKVGEGQFNLQLNTRRKDEIGKLSESMTQMVDRLRENKLQVDRQLDRLSRVNRELEQVQREALNTERLAYVGRVAAGVAHEVGNPLAAVMSYLEILRDGFPGEEEYTDYLRRIESELSRIDEIMKGLLDFARPSESRPSQIHVGGVAREALDTVKKQRVMDNVELTLEEHPEIPMVWVDEKELFQVLINLLINARDALGQEGVVRIRMDRIEFDRLSESLPTLEDDRQEESGSLHRYLKENVCFSGKIPFKEGEEVVRIAVSDNGRGIDKDHISHIFDPFFTTKSPGKGTGLGLTISQRIIETYGGVIKAESKLGTGTVFTIYLQTVPPEKTVDEERETDRDERPEDTDHR